MARYTKIPSKKLKALLVSYAKRQRAEQAKMMQLFHQAFSESSEQCGLTSSTSSEDAEHSGLLPGTSAALELFDDITSSLIAKRLKADDRSVALISAEDVVAVVPPIVQAYSAEYGEELPEEERLVAEKFISDFVGQNLSNFSSMVVASTGKDLYDAYADWIPVVIKLASQAKMEPADFYATEAGRNDVMRKLYSREEYVACAEKTIVQFVSLDHFRQTYRQLVIEPLFNSAANLAAPDEKPTDAEVLQAIEETVQENDPMIQEAFKVANKVAQEYLDSETIRIYGRSL